MTKLDALFSPRSVAVVGASRRPRSVGYEVVANLLRSGFDGPVYPINPTARSVHSVPAFPSLSAVPGPVDLAVITVPRDAVLSAVEEAIAKGVKALVTITAGFKEVDEEGARIEAILRARLRETGVRMVGPNCMGLINTDPSVSLNASFTASQVPVGGVAVASQSGALGEALLETATDLGLGLSAFVSLGNKTDLSGNDLLEHWADDPRTRLVLLYLESFGNPGRFAQLARYMTRVKKKPILAVKAGRTAQGARAASSHTGALAGADVAIDSLLRQCGVIRVDTVSKLFASAQAFAHQPVPHGRRIAIFTNAGGPGIMATDSAVHFGLTLAELSDETRKKLRATLPKEASVDNPVDAIATSGADQYRIGVETTLLDPSVDGLIVIFVSPVMIDAEDVARAIVSGVEAARAAGAGEKPVLSCFMGKHKGDAGVRVLRDARIPVYPFPEAAAESLAEMARFGAYLSEPVVEPQPLDPAPDVEAAKQVLADARARLGKGGGWLRFGEAMRILEAYRIPAATWRTVSNAAEAVAFAEEQGYPIVLKVDSDTILHKTEKGGVLLDLVRAQDVRGAFAELRANVADIPGDHRFVAQKMVRGDAETLMGVTTDPSVGHLIGFGLGGIFAELMHDVVFRVPPLTDFDAQKMLEGIRGAPLLSGARGGTAIDQAALRRVLLRVSKLVEDLPEIVELDLNPFLASAVASKQAAVDARIRVASLG